MLKIEIVKRHYNGDYCVGSIFKENYLFEIDNNLCISKNTKSFCISKDLGSNTLSDVTISIPFVLNSEDINKLNNLLDLIKKNDEFKYNENHYLKNKFDFKFYNYMDIIINNIEYELSENNNNDIIKQLYTILNIEFLNKTIDNTIKNIVSDDTKE